ncbi:MAG: hypothetical protein AB8H47_14845 [Bacteroidia bacterium]
MYYYRLLALLPIILPYCLWGQLQLLADPNNSSNTLSSEIAELTIFQGEIYAYAESEDQTGLWRLDTLTQSMELIQAGIEIREMVATDSLLIFVASNYENGLELWRSDGTEMGTSRYYEWIAGRNSRPLFNLQVIFDKVYFIRQKLNFEHTLWCTDGTNAGTYSLHNIAWRGFQSDIGELAIADSLIYFWGSDSQSGVGVFQTDGSVAGTSLRYTNPNWSSFRIPHHLVGLDSLVYFWDDLATPNLWQIRKDTVISLLKAHNQSFVFPQPYQVVKFLDEHYFVSGNQGPAVVDSIILWRTNGDFTQREKVFSAAARELPLGLFANEHVLYLLYRNIQSKFSIIKTDGISISPVYSDFIYTENTVGGVLLDSVLIFTTSSSTGELIKTDATANGTLSLGGFRPSRNFHTGDLDAVIYRDEIYLTGVGLMRSFGDRELFRTDGQNLSLVSDINPVPVSGFISALTPFQNKFIFSALNDSLGQEPWISEGTVSTTKNLLDIWPDSLLGQAASSFPLNFTPLGNKIYFQATDSSVRNLSRYYKKLWYSDGSAAGSQQAIDYVWTGAGRSYSNLVTWQNQLFFAAVKADPLVFPDVELYTYSPNLDTAILVADLWVGGQSEPKNLVSMDDHVFFTAYTLHLRPWPRVVAY